MSVWTHVAAVFRVDSPKVGMDGPRINGYVKPDWDKVTGKAIYEYDWCTDDDYEIQRGERSWDEYEGHPEEFMPAGSEGSLQRVVWVNPNRSCANRYTVTVFGDLRDYDDHQAIKEWFELVCSRCHMRQAACNCMVEGQGSWTWSQEWDGDEDA